MLQKLKEILSKDSLKQVGVYTITGSVCKAISFAALPFFVNMLSEGDIGILNIFSNSIVFLTPIVSMGVLYTISIDYFKLPKEKFAVVFSTSLIIPLVFCVLLTPMLYFLRTPLENQFQFQYNFFWLIPICLFLNFCFEAFIVIIRNQNKVQLFTKAYILKVVVEIGLSIIFILFFYKSWYGRALGFLIAGIAVGWLFFYHVKKQGFLVNTIDYTILKSELYFGLSGMILQTAVFFMNSSDKFFVIANFGKEQAGYYAVASTFATIQFLICASLLQYLQPVLYKRYAKLQTWQQVKGLYTKYAIAMFVTLIAVVLFAYVVYTYILKSTYKEYLHYFYILSISAFVWTISNVFLQFIVFNKNKKIIFQFSVLSIFVSFGVNFFCAKYYDVTALAWGQVFTNLIAFLLILYFDKKLNYFVKM